MLIENLAIITISNRILSLYLLVIYPLVEIIVSFVQNKVRLKDWEKSKLQMFNSNVLSPVVQNKWSPECGVHRVLRIWEHLREAKSS